MSVRKNFDDDIDEVMIEADKLQARITELAREISADYTHTEDLLLICTLKGAYIFLSDLSRAIARPHKVEFMAVSSYHGGTESSGVVQLLLDLRESITDRHVLIVEDIVDSGNTLSYLRELLLQRKPASLKIVTLLDKPERRTSDVPIDYIGFEIPDEFVVGYGLDFDELYRNLPHIAILKPRVFAHLFE